MPNRSASRAAPALAIAMAIVGAAAVLSAARFRSPVDGAFLPSGWTAALSVFAVSVVTAAWRTRWRKAGGYFAVGLVCQSAELNLINAPNFGFPEHYFPWSDFASWPGILALGIPVIQLGLSVYGAKSLGLRFDPARTGLTRGQLVLAILGCVAIATNGSFSVGQFGWEIGLALLIVVANLANLVVVAATIPEQAFIASRSILDREGHWFAPVVALAVVIASASIALLVFDRTPVIPDAVAYLFQAKYFAAGKVALPTPPEFPAFDFVLTHSDGVKWWAYGFPGWPAVLAIGVRLGVPWLVNPVLAGATVLMAHALLDSTYGPGFARRAILLLAASPWFLFMSASHMAHTVSLFWIAAALLTVHHAWRTGHARWGALGGAALGMAFATRPLEALLLAPAFGLLLLGITGHRLHWKGIAAFVVGGVVPTVLQLQYHKAITGSHFRTPHSVFADGRDYPGADRLGFGPDIGNLGWTQLDPLPGHGLPDVLINAHQNAHMVSADLFGWRFGSLLFVLIFFLLGRRKPPDRIFAVMIASIVLGHSVYWFSGGPDIGARYWYLALLPLVVLTVRGVQEVGAMRGTSAAHQLGRTGAFVAVASVIAVLTFIPWRSLGKYHHYRGLSGNLRRLANDVDFGHSVVFVRERDKSDYANAFGLNRPEPEECRPVFARDLGPESRSRIERFFPDRDYWLIEGPVNAGGPFTVLERPGRSIAPQQCRRGNK